jgi:signal transduction histidine kinase
VIGILSTAQSTAFFQKIISEIVADLNIGISLIDKDGHIIYSNRYPYKKEVIGYPSFEFVRKAVKGKRDVVEIRDLSDQDKTKYVSFEPVEGIGWSVIVEKGKGEVLQSEFTYFIQLGIISFLVLTGVAFSLLYLRQKYKQVRSLRESESRLQLLTSQLLTAQENERKRIAHELHDSIGASLGAIKFKAEDVIEQIKRGTVASDSFKALIPMIQGAVQETRRIMADLRPSVLDDLGVLAAINWYCREFENTYSDIRIQKEIEISEDEVPVSLKTPIYRIMQEALNNIAKHSKADLVTLCLRKTGEPIELTIRDNGQGFNTEETPARQNSEGGLGLSSMRERVELMGGSFSIESRKGMGTVIRAIWPIE